MLGELPSCEAPPPPGKADLRFYYEGSESPRLRIRTRSQGTPEGFEQGIRSCVGLKLDALRPTIRSNDLVVSFHFELK